MWFKGLVAVTCVAILAALGLWFYQERQETLVAQERANARFCDTMLSDLSQHRTKEYKAGEIGWCVARGHLAEQDFREAGAMAYFNAAKDTISLFTKD